MYVDPNLQRLREADKVSLSPVLLAALDLVGMPVSALVSDLVASQGRLRVGYQTEPGLAMVIPAGSYIDSNGTSIDLCMADDYRPLHYRYCEVDQVPFIDLPATNIPDNLLCVFHGLPLTTLLGDPFPALAAVDPIIHSPFHACFRQDRWLRASFGFDWLKVSCPQ